MAFIKLIMHFYASHSKLCQHISPLLANRQNPPDNSNPNPPSRNIARSSSSRIAVHKVPIKDQLMSPRNREPHPFTHMPPFSRLTKNIVHAQHRPRCPSESINAVVHILDCPSTPRKLYYAMPSFVSRNR